MANLLFHTWDVGRNKETEMWAEELTKPTASLPFCITIRTQKVREIGACRTVHMPFLPLQNWCILWKWRTRDLGISLTPPSSQEKSCVNWKIPSRFLSNSIKTSSDGASTAPKEIYGRDYCINKHNTSTVSGSFTVNLMWAEYTDKKTMEQINP